MQESEAFKKLHSEQTLNGRKVLKTSGGQVRGDDKRVKMTVTLTPVTLHLH